MTREELHDLRTTVQKQIEHLVYIIDQSLPKEGEPDLEFAEGIRVLASSPPVPMLQLLNLLRLLERIKALTPEDPIYDAVRDAWSLYRVDKALGGGVSKTKAAEITAKKYGVKVATVRSALQGRDPLGIADDEQLPGNNGSELDDQGGGTIEPPRPWKN